MVGEALEDKSGEAPQRPKFAGLSSKVFLVCIGVFILSLTLVAAIYAFLDNTAKPDTIRGAITLDAAKVLTQLAVIGVVGAVIKFLLDEYAAGRRAHEAQEADRKRQRDARMEFRKDLWRELRSVYGRVEKSRNLIEGGKSARIYDEQLRGIMDLRLALGEIRHEVAFSGDTFESKVDLASHVRAMEKYLERLIDEYGDRNATLLAKQALHEKASDSTVLDMDADLNQLPVLRDLRDADERGLFHNEFRMNYYRARQAILQEFEKTLRIKGRPIAPEAEQRIRDSIKRFERYLRAQGARFGQTTTVDVKDDEEMAALCESLGLHRTLAFYDINSNDLVIALHSVDNMDVALREFCFRAFHEPLEDRELRMAVKNLAVEGPAAAVGAVIAGFGYYLPCSFKNDPRFDLVSVMVDLRAPDPDVWRRAFVGAPPALRRWLRINDPGERWAAVFWALREAFGPEVLDRILVGAWNETLKSMSQTDFHAKFVAKLTALAGKVDSSAKTTIAEVLEGHGLKG